MRQNGCCDVESNFGRGALCAAAALIWFAGPIVHGAEPVMIDLRGAVVYCPKATTEREKFFAKMLVEEVENRSGIRWRIVDERPGGEAATIEFGRVTWAGSSQIEEASVVSIMTRLEAEGYAISTPFAGTPGPVIVAGHDTRGMLFAAGRFLREARMANDRVEIPAGLSIASSPAYPIRGHQIGFRHRANSWDAWTVAEMEQHIRELTFFGVNSIENIPFQDADPMTLAKVDRRTMNRAMSEICAKYGLDYWVWTPADFDLNDAELRAEMLAKHEELYRDCPELTGVFFPGGDPGDNAPDLVMPFLEDIAERLLKAHPKAKVWLSLQGFGQDDVAYVREYIERAEPPWLGGLVAGPGSPPIAETRRWLPERYALRLYPDITHNKLSQYEVPWWDPAYALTLGREAINPRPVQYAYIHNWYAPYSEGFISYSDGVHDDVNKVVWSALGWDPAADVREVLIEYGRVFFGPDVAEEAADGLLALEKNWRGPLATNGAVEGTLAQWQRLERAYPELAGDWRWQMNVLRANYDAYVRRRLLNETRLEREANRVLAERSIHDPDAAMDAAMAILNRAVTGPESPDLRARIEELCGALYESIHLQTSVPKYQASGAERGAILDFVDYPMNNRWWLEDEFAKVRGMASKDEKAARLRELAAWENPGPGSFYDDIGNTAKSPRVRRSEEVFTVPTGTSSPTHWWWDNGMSRARLSWQTSMDWPEAVVYEGLDAGASYIVRTTGYGKGLLRVDGERVEPTVDGREIGEFKEFPVPAASLADRKIELTWDRPADEGHLNWRQQSRVSEVWLLKED